LCSSRTTIIKSIHQGSFQGAEFCVASAAPKRRATGAAKQYGALRFPPRAQKFVQRAVVSFIYSFLAARCEIPQLQAAMLEAWTTLEVAEPAQEFASSDDAYRWAGPRCGYLAGAHPHDVKLLYRNGVWSVISDISTCMASDAESLADLSRRLGRVIVATTQGTVGFAELQVFEAGAAIRSITGQAGRTTQAGTPIPEEEGVPLEPFYLDELDTIWRRLGLSSFLEGDSAGPVLALHVLDRTPVAEIVPAPGLAQRGMESRSRPWWQLW
jgi:hypothetical protein